MHDLLDDHRQPQRVDPVMSTGSCQCPCSPEFPVAVIWNIWSIDIAVYNVGIFALYICRYIAIHNVGTSPVGQENIVASGKFERSEWVWFNWPPQKFIGCNESEKRITTSSYAWFKLKPKSCFSHWTFGCWVYCWIVKHLKHLLFKEKYFQFHYCFSPKWLFQAHLREVSLFLFSFIFSILHLPEDLLQWGKSGQRHPCTC